MHFINAGNLLGYCRLTYLPMAYLYGKRFIGPITPLILQIREEIYNEPYEKLNWRRVRHLCAKVSWLLAADLQKMIWKHFIFFKICLFLQEDNYYPHTSIQILFWDAIYTFGEPLLTRWPFNKLREKALNITMDHIHYEDESSRYITIGCVEKVTHLQSNGEKENQYSKTFAYYTCSLIFGHLYHWTGTAIRYAGLLGWRCQWGLF
jgi:beta-amyrin synthase